MASVGLHPLPTLWGVAGHRSELSCFYLRGRGLAKREKRGHLKLPVMGVRCQELIATNVRLQSVPLDAIRTSPGSLPASCHRQSMRPALVHVRARAAQLRNRLRIRDVFTTSELQSFGLLLCRRIGAHISQTHFSSVLPCLCLLSHALVAFTQQDEYQLT